MLYYYFLFFPMTFSTSCLLNKTGEKATYYKEGNTWYNACNLLPKSDYFVAMNKYVYDNYTTGAGANPNWPFNTLCGTCIKVSYNNKSIVLVITDKCMGCGKFYDGQSGIDLSESAAQYLNPDYETVGFFNINYESIPCKYERVFYPTV